MSVGPWRALGAPVLTRLLFYIGNTTAVYATENRDRNSIIDAGTRVSVKRNPSFSDEWHLMSCQLTSLQPHTPTAARACLPDLPPLFTQQHPPARLPPRSH